MKTMTDNHTSNRRSDHRPVLAAAVGLGDILLDRTLATNRRAICAGGTARCDLPFPGSRPVAARRSNGAWTITVPADTDVQGAEVVDGRIKLYDWDGGVTLSVGDAWLRLWPTRSAPFTDTGRFARMAGYLGRALPLAWVALALTIGLGTFGLWAGGALQGNPSVFALGEDGGGLGTIPDRVASFGEGDTSTGQALSAWVSVPTSLDDSEDAIAEVDEPEEIDEAEPQPQPAQVPAEPRDAAPEAQPTNETAPNTAAADADATADASATGAAGAAGAGSFGLGGGTDDGYADRSDSARALEHVLVSCMEGSKVHRLELAVGVDGRAIISDWQGSWTASERTCAQQAIDDWAFPAGGDTYEVSLKMRQGSRRSRV